MMKITSVLLTLTLLSTVPVSAGETFDNLKFGPQQESSGERLDGVAAIVGNDIITVKELNRAGNNVAALERLIMEKLLLQAAKERNIIIGDTALNIALDEARANGKFISRDDLRKQLLIGKLQQGVASNLVNITDQEISNMVEQQLRRSDTRLKVIDVLVRVPESADSETLQRAQQKTQKILQLLKSQSPDLVAKRFEEVYFRDLGWIDLAQIPSTFAKILVDAPEQKFLDPIIDRDGLHLLKILARDAEREDQLIELPETRVSHILIKEQGNAKAKAIIDDLYRRLQTGADFAELAKQYSQDLGSATDGGALGWAYPGQMVPDFEAVMNKTPIAKISPPFKSPFGYHILKVHERRHSSQNKSNRELLEQKARRAIFQKRASEEWDLWLSRLRDEAYVEVLK